jgi:hypothetical protein
MEYITTQPAAAAAIAIAASESLDFFCLEAELISRRYGLALFLARRHKQPEFLANNLTPKFGFMLMTSDNEIPFFPCHTYLLLLFQYSTFSLIALYENCNMHPEIEHHPLSRKRRLNIKGFRFVVDA